MGKRRVQSAPYRDPVTGRWKLTALPLTDRSYLGGLTLPLLTSRPHMGPFNRVNDYKLSDADEVYRQHDIGYGRLAARGYNPYVRWNRYDDDLMNAPSTGWPDYVAKGVFALKKFGTYGLPYVQTPQFKPVYSQPESTFFSPEKEYNDYKNRTSDVPDLNMYYGGDFSGSSAQQAYSWSRRGQMTNYSTESTSIPSGGGKFRTSVRYEKI